MMDIFESIACLTCKDAKAASCYADQITAESRKDGRWTPFLTDFSALLHHKNSLVRNRSSPFLPPMQNGPARKDLVPCWTNYSAILLTKNLSLPGSAFRQCQKLPRLILP